MNKPVELRIRGERPYRLQLGVARSKAELARLQARRALLSRLHARGETDVLDAVKAGRVGVEEVERLVDQYGVADYRAHLSLAPDVSVPTLDQHVEAWFETIEKPSTLIAYKAAMRRLLDAEVDGRRLGERPWHRIARHTIRDVKASLDLATNTVRLSMGAWSSFFTWAIEREQSEAEEQGRDPVLETNPVRASRSWSKIERTRHRFLSWEEFQRLLAKSPAPMRAQYATLALAGLRIQEFIVLPPAHVHLPTHLHIGPWGDWAPKGYPRYTHGVRDVPIHRSVLLPLLEEYAERYAGERTFFVNPNRLQPWSYTAFADRLKKDLRAAGLRFGQFERGEDGGLERIRDGITPHTFRHSLASWMAQRDVQLMKIARVLGDTEETVRLHYSHLLPSDIDQSLNRVGVE